MADHARIDDCLSAREDVFRRDVMPEHLRR
jgi:hypothetical protein